MITYGSTTLTSYNSIVKTEVYYYKSTDATALSGGSWSTTKPTWESGKYVWQKIRTIYEDGNYSESDPVNITGQQGATGTAAYSYKLNTSDSIITKSQTGEYSSTSVTFSATYKQGTGAVTAYAGRFIIQTSADGTTWSTVYTSSANESSKAYTVPSNILIIKCSLYQAGGTTVLLDQVTVPIVKDGINGTGLKDSIPIYLASDKETGVTIKDHGWIRYRPQLNATHKYLWVYYVSRYGNGNTEPELIEKNGDIINFEYHGDESPLENIKTNIEPVQDLHGYDYPWSGGAGKNKLEIVEMNSTSNGITANVNTDGSIVLDGTATAGSILIWNFAMADATSSEQSNNKKNFPNGTYKIWNMPTGTRFQVRGSNSEDAGSSDNNSIIDSQSGNFTIDDTYKYNWGRLYIENGAAFSNVIFYPMITLSTETDSSYTPYENICPIKPHNTIRIWNSPTVPKHYGVVWDQQNSTLTRTGDAKDITTTTTNFKYSGSVNANYNNPFDSIYPWSECKLCNIDIVQYMALNAGDPIEDCVIAWEDDDSFSYTHENGVWKYTPEFWGTSWTDPKTDKRYYDICDRPCSGYIHYKPSITGRWHGIKETRSIDGTNQTILLPKPGIVCTNEAIQNMHGYANKFNATLTNIFTLDAAALMFIIEYASMNCQSAIGNGVSSLYRQSSDTFTSATANSTMVHVTKANATLCIPNAIMDIGTSNGGTQVGKYYIKSIANNASDNAILDVTLDRAVTVTTSNYWSIHGSTNVADEVIGSKSGYIGVNGRTNAYYRGEVLWGNFWQYILGAYKRTGTQHVWLAKNETDADSYNALNTSVHYDTNIKLSTTNGYIKRLQFLKEKDILAAPAFCIASGGNSTNPVGDYFYINVNAGNTVLVAGGRASSGANAGVFCWHWNVTGSYSAWDCAARPSLKHP